MRILIALALLIATAGFTACSQDRAALLPTAPSTAATPVLVTHLRAFIIDTAQRALSDVRVEILDGPASGQSFVTGDDGTAAMVGDFTRDTRFRASKSGHETWTSMWQCSVATCPSNGTPYVFITLRPLAPPLELAGEYTMTIMADASCPSLPTVARSRSYAVTVTKRFREGTADLLGYNAEIHNADVLPQLQHFGIGIAGNYVSIFFQRGEGDRPGLIEQLGDNTYMLLTASARGSVSQSTTVSLEFEGSIEYVTTRVPLTGGVNETIVTASRETCAEGNRLLLVRR